jgi:hypothetical protein
MSIDPKIQQATADIGGFTLTAYRDKRGVLHAANAVSALGAWAGAFAQAQARAMLVTGALPNTETSLLEVKTKDGGRYFFGDSINVCLMEGDNKSPSFWKMAAPVAGDAEAAAKIDVLEIARRAAKGVGGSDFGKPHIDARYKLSEQPINALRIHGPVLARRLAEIELSPLKLMTVFGSVAQSFAAFAAGEIKDVPVTVPMKREDIVRLYMESAIPMSKIDMSTVGMAA